MGRAPDDQLDQARSAAGLSQRELWLRYFGLGGAVPALELEAIVLGALKTDEEDRDRIVHALNERFTELGRNHPVPYSDSVPGTEGGMDEIEPTGTADS